MKFKPSAAWLPLVLLSLSGAARADLEPFSFGAGETIQHESNVFHTSSGATSDWLSTTELHGALDQALGRDRLTANASVNYSNYRKLDERDAWGYRGNVGFDWSTIGDLSGSLGASSDRHIYLYGIADENPQTDNTTRNVETTNRAFANVTLGGLARWSIYGGGSVSNRDYSAASFKSNEERQWDGNIGTRYATSPDLSFGIVGSYSHGEYPNYVDSLNAAAKDRFTSRSLSATTRWQASGASSLDAQLGFTTESGDLQSKRNFLSGYANWTWAPEGHFKVLAGLSRSSSGGVGSGATGTLNDRSLNTSGNLDVTYALTAKISLAADAAYIRRQYSGGQVVAIEDGQPKTLDGSNHSTSFGLSVHYQPTRTTDVNCGGTHENRSANSALGSLLPGYTDTTYHCSASINFN